MPRRYYLHDILDSLISAKRSGKPQNDVEENNAPAPGSTGRTPSSALNPAKRGASSLDANNSASNKRARRGPEVSKEEKERKKKLASGVEHHNATASLPNVSTSGQPSAHSEMSKRKPLPGAFRPINSLGKTAFAPTSSRISSGLDIKTFAGDNVSSRKTSPYFPSEHPHKRQKLSQPGWPKALSEDAFLSAIPLPDDDFFHREVVSSPGPSLHRKTSTHTVDSQDLAKQLPPPLFGTNEIRDLDFTIKSKKTHSRSKGPGASASSSHVDPADVIEIMDSQSPRKSQTRPPASGRPTTSVITITEEPAPVTRRQPSRANTAQGTTKPPATDVHVSVQIPKRVIQIPSAFDDIGGTSQLGTVSRFRRPPGSTSSPANKSKKPDQDQSPRSPSPPLSKIFVRDQPPEPASKKGLRERMKATSGATTRRASNEGSEDELALSRRPDPKNSHVPVPSPKNLKLTASKTSSPGNTRRDREGRDPGRYSDPKQYQVLKLESIYTQSIELSVRDDSLDLVYNYGENVFFVERDGKSVLGPARPHLYTLNNKHANSAQWSPEDDWLHLSGARDDVTGGEILFTFTKHEDVDICLGLVKTMTSNKVVTKPAKDKYASQNVLGQIRNKIEYRRKSSAEKDPELLGMINRQGAREAGGTRAITARERTRQIQSGEAPEGQSPNIHGTRRQKMISEYTTQEKHSEQDIPPPKEHSAEPPQQPVRTSRRTRKETTPPKSEPKPKQRWSVINKLPAWDGPLVYPAVGTKRTTVEVSDLVRLDEGQWLNDNLIAFCLRRLEETHPKFKDQVHIFNTFFYTTLTTKDGKSGVNYDAVKRWTKNIDIFSYPFVVVPVNKSFHWWVAIICNLDKLQPRSTDSQRTRDVDSVCADIETSPQPGDQPVLSSDVKAVDDTGNILEFPGTPKPQGQAAKAPQASAKNSKKKNSPPVRKYSPDQIAILTLDSFGAPRSAETRNLKDYIIREGLEKRGLEITRNDIQGVMARGVPEQNNDSDCGVYSVGFVKEFLKDPRTFVGKILSRELDASKDFVGFDASEQRNEIREDLIALEAEQREAKRKRKKAERDAKLAAGEAGAGPTKPKEAAKKDKDTTATATKGAASNVITLSSNSTNSASVEVIPKAKTTATGPKGTASNVISLSSNSTDSTHAGAKAVATSRKDPLAFLSGIEEAANS